MKPAIRVENLSKQYRIGKKARPRSHNLTESIADGASALWRGLTNRTRGGDGADEFWALKDVSFEVQPGEVVGIIGRNGAGKSTLLKILSRIAEPTSGRAVVRGRMASLLEVGTGFHPELTGRENVYLNGSILGMCRREINRKFDEIAAFAEIDQFLDTPVKRYSSGMYVRLAFAVAAHLEPEILIIDEVLAVGDAGFQAKCLGQMGAASRAGRTVLFVTHNMAAIRALCQRVMVLQGGSIVCDGSDVTAGIETYSCKSHKTGLVWEATALDKEKVLQIERIALQIGGEQPDHRLSLALRLRSQSPHKPAFVAAEIHSALGETIMQALPTIKPFLSCDHRVHELDMEVDLPPMIPGRYTVSVWVGGHFSDTLDHVERQVEFEVGRSPTPGRAFPYSGDHGYIVPRSSISNSTTQTWSAG
jgi:lipopolysaccharide transport system ATP-binding protein